MRAAAAFLLARRRPLDFEFEPPSPISDTEPPPSVSVDIRAFERVLTSAPSSSFVVFSQAFLFMDRTVAIVSFSKLI